MEGAGGRQEGVGLGTSPGQVREDGAQQEAAGWPGEGLRCGPVLSSSSLVSTNEHLLQELSQVRAQHKAEVEQLHWSYKELKKTMALFPHGSAGLGGC